MKRKERKKNTHKKSVTEKERKKRSQTFYNIYKYGCEERLMYYLFRPYIVSNDFSITTIRRVKMVVKDQLNSLLSLKQYF